MAYQTPRIERIKDNVIRIYHPDIIEPKTYLTASVAATGTTLTVADNAGYSNTDPQDLLLLEGLGIETAEITRVNGAITAGTSLTVQAVIFAHGVNTSIQKILFNKFEVRGSNTDAATAASTNGTIVQFAGSNTTPINVTGQYTDFVVTGTTYTYYGVRFYNSLVTTTYYSAFSDGIIGTDFTPKTVGFIRRNAFKNIGETFDGRFTADWVYDQIYLGELDVLKELKRWSWLYVFDNDLGNITTGLRRIALPTDIEDDRTNKSILGLRVANDPNLTYMDKTDYEILMQNIPYTTLSSTAAIGATTLVLTDSRDFADSGSVNIQGTSYTYTGNTRSTNTLTGLTALTAEITSGAEIWQNITFGTPLKYAIIDGYAHFDIPPDSSFSGRNIWIDYYKTITKLDSDTDEISVNDPQILISWLEMAIKKEKANGELALNDISLIEYNRRKQLLKANELSGQKISLVPNVYTYNEPPYFYA